MRRGTIKLSLQLFVFGISCVAYLFGCKQKHPEPSAKPIAEYVYRYDERGDGLVNFTADSSQGATEYRWRFGENTDIVTTTKPGIQYTFPANGKYKVTLTCTSNSGELTTSQTINIVNKLARKFVDLPTDQRDTLRILCVLTHESFVHEFENLASKSFDAYENQVFVNFLDRTIPDHPAELSGLVIQKIFYKLTAAEMNRFNQTDDPIAFLNSLFTQPADVLFQQILDQKRSKAAAKIAFYLKDPAPGGISKYGIGGYSVYEGSYFVLLSHGSYVHELAHSFGLAHDTERDCSYVPVMSGSETQTTGNCISLWNSLPEFQVKGTVTSMALLRAANYYDFAVPTKYQAEFPSSTFLRNIDITHISTTPYYRSGVDMLTTITDALLVQYNIRQNPSLAINLDTNPQIPEATPNSSVSLKKTKIVSCGI
jgi:PKD repeat protein